MSTPRPIVPDIKKNGGRWSMLSVSLFDLAAGAVSMWSAVHLRYLLEPQPTPEHVLIQSVSVFALACAIVFPLQKLHRGVWRYTALNDAARIVQAVILANLVFLPVFFLINRLEDFPRTSMLIEIPILIGILLGARVCVAAWHTQGLRAALQFEDRSKPAAILVGTETELDDALRDFARRNGSNPFRIKALAAPYSDLAGRSIRGVSVIGGLDALPKALSRLSDIEKNPPRLVLASLHPESSLVNTLIRIAAKSGARLTRARPGKGPNAFSPIEAADLLNRPPRAPDLEPARSLIEGKRVLVTGAGGTIGSELARLAANLNPEKIILLDSSEANLYEIDMEFSTRNDGVCWRAVLADVRDQVRLDQVFKDEKPHLVLHAGALKHVPLSEINPVEATRTNVLGTMRTIEAAQNHNVGVVALISTDKAVEPSNIMGASKRAAELYARSVATDSETTRVCVVRFGNVLGSTGSVGPLFERQIEAGGPVTVTDPEATRYFMTVEEASGLVLSAAAQTAENSELNGALYVFDMGEPISILRFARQLIRLRGKDPDAFDAVSIIGLRAGEKRHEALVYEYEKTQPSQIERVWVVNGPTPDEALLEIAMKKLFEAAETRDVDAVKLALHNICTIRPDSQGD